MKWFKWYYIAIPIGIWLLYEMVAPKPTLLKPGTNNSGSGYLNGIGNASTGLGKLWSSIFGASKSTDTPSTDATGD